MRTEFQVHMLNENGKARANDIAESFSALLSKIETHSSEGREFSLIKTKLEEACFYAKKAMASRKENQI